METFDAETLKKLNSFYENAYFECQNRLHRWKKFEQDYQNLSQRLSKISDETKHSIMVPFGKHAFMPGELIHTNEVLVLLGDNYFVERSAKQSIEMIERRLIYVQENLSKTYKEISELEIRSNLEENSDEIIEIEETLDGEPFSESTKKLLHQVEQEKKQEKFSNFDSKKDENEEENIFSQLEILEKLENLEILQQENEKSTGNSKNSLKETMNFSAFQGSASAFSGIIQEKVEKERNFSPENDEKTRPKRISKFKQSKMQ
eukprot:Sdes_comp18189_c0_seq1m7718